MGLPPLTEDDEAQVERWLEALTLEQKLQQLSGDVPRSPRGLRRLARYNSDSFPSGDDPEHGIPPLRFADGPRGLVLGASTAFPVSMARGATFDPDLEEQVGDAIGVELRSHGATLFGGVCINLLRHPGWGRAQETYGEDSHHLGEMGAALVRGVQRHAMACIKHYACNSIENRRFKVDVQVDQRTLRETYLAHFRRCVDEGAAVVMTAYNKVNGVHCGHHAFLNRDVLRDDWGFAGITISDWMFGVRDGVAGLLGGLDVEMPIQHRYGRALRRAVERGEVSMAVVDEAVRRVLRTKLRFAGVGEPDRYGPQAVASDAHRALAREVATRSMVLLRNEPVDGAPVLPLDVGGAVSRVAVVGRLADLPVTGDKGSSKVSPPHVVTPLEGLRRALAGRADVVAETSGDTEAAVAAASGADVAVAVVGYTHRDEGEYVFAWGGDRESLRLRPADESLVARVAAANPRTVVVLICGSAVVTAPWDDDVAGLVVAWYPGMEGGHALADLLTGAESFGGRLPFAIPRSEGDLPPFDPSAGAVVYGPLHGYRWLAYRGRPPAYPFGFGLGYTTFAYGEPRATVTGDAIEVTVEVANTGERAGDEVVQVYASRPDSAVDRAPLDLVAFRRVTVEPGATRETALRVPLTRLEHYDVQASDWVLESGPCRLGVGPSSDPATHREVTVNLPGH